MIQKAYVESRLSKLIFR